MMELLICDALKIPIEIKIPLKLYIPCYKRINFIYDKKLNNSFVEVSAAKIT